MQNFSFLGGVQVVFPLLFQAGRQQTVDGQLEKTKIRQSLSPTATQTLVPIIRLRLPSRARALAEPQKTPHGNKMQHMSQVFIHRYCICEVHLNHRYCICEVYLIHRYCICEAHLIHRYCICEVHLIHRYCICE